MYMSTYNYFNSYFQETFSYEGYTLYLQKRKLTYIMNILFYLLLSLVIFTILLYPLLRKAVSLLEILVNKYIQQSSFSNKSQTDKDKTATQTIINLKLLAYERIILLTERLKPDSLIPRTISTTLSYKEYQILLLNEIRKEFEYNLSQQLYLSENTWTIVTNFKNNMTTLINTAAADCSSDATAHQLAQKILENYITSDLKADQILKIIKTEVQAN